MRLADYIEKFGPEIVAKVENSTRPLLPASETPPETEALRKPYEAQHRVIEAARRTLDLQPACFVIGEMGTGKTLIGALIPRPGTRTIILCPGHLIGKWKSEIEKTVPNATAKILRTMSDCRSAANAPQVSGRSYFFILSKETGKLGYLWKPATRTKTMTVEVYDRELKCKTNKTAEYALCPDCGKIIESTDAKGVSTPTEARRLTSRKMKCSCQHLPRRYERDGLGRKTEITPERGKEPKIIRCNAPLWSADGTKNRKIALAEYLKRLKCRFDYLILDEAHEFKSADSAQANAFGTLASISDKAILLTGTLIGGYATHLYYLLWRILPRPMKARGYKYDNSKLFIEQFGVTETVTREYSGEVSSNKRSKGSNKTSATAEKPGISPKLFTEFLLGNGIFLQLDDLGANLPTLTETPIAIRPSADQYDAYKLLEGQLKNAIAADLARGNKRLLGKLLVNLLAYPDKPFDLSAIDLNDGRFINPRNLSSAQIFPKEAELIDIASAAKARNSKTLVYCQYTSSRDIQPRLQELLEAHGLKTAILRSAVKPELREAWIKDHDDIDCLICNPEIVKTGLDLYDYTTIVFFQTGYNIFTLRQASRRSWRLGQTQPVNIFYLYYSDTMQARAIDLIARKLSAATALDGKLSADGLNALAEEDDALLLARALVDGLAPTEKIAFPETPHHDKEETMKPEPVPVTEAPVEFEFYSLSTGQTTTRTIPPADTPRWKRLRDNRVWLQSEIPAYKLFIELLLEKPRTAHELLVETRESLTTLLNFKDKTGLADYKDTRKKRPHNPRIIDCTFFLKPTNQPKPEAPDRPLADLTTSRSALIPLPVPKRLDAGQLKESLGYTGPALIDTMLDIEAPKQAPVINPTPQVNPERKTTTGQVKDLDYYRELKAARLRNEKAGLKQTEFKTTTRHQDQLSLFG